jgi:hypothetical protein
MAYRGPACKRSRGGSWATFAKRSRAAVVDDEVLGDAPDSPVPLPAVPPPPAARRVAPPAPPAPRPSLAPPHLPAPAPVSVVAGPAKVFSVLPGPLREDVRTAVCTWVWAHVSRKVAPPREGRRGGASGGSAAQAPPSKVLVIRGPPGCGKRSYVRKVCAHYGVAFGVPEAVDTFRGLVAFMTQGSGAANAHVGSGPPPPARAWYFFGLEGDGTPEAALGALLALARGGDSGTGKSTAALAGLVVIALHEFTAPLAPLRTSPDVVRVSAGAKAPDLRRGAATVGVTAVAGAAVVVTRTVWVEGGAEGAKTLQAVMHGPEAGPGEPVPVPGVEGKWFQLTVNRRSCTGVFAVAVTLHGRPEGAAAVRAWARDLRRHGLCNVVWDPPVATVVVTSVMGGPSRAQVVLDLYAGLHQRRMWALRAAVTTLAQDARRDCHVAGMEPARKGFAARLAASLLEDEDVARWAGACNTLDDVLDLERAVGPRSDITMRLACAEVPDGGVPADKPRHGGGSRGAAAAALERAGDTVSGSVMAAVRRELGSLPEGARWLLKASGGGMEGWTAHGEGRWDRLVATDASRDVDLVALARDILGPAVLDMFWQNWAPRGPGAVVAAAVAWEGRSLADTVSWRAQLDAVDTRAAHSVLDVLPVVRARRDVRAPPFAPGGPAPLNFATTDRKRRDQVNEVRLAVKAHGATINAALGKLPGLPAFRLGPGSLLEEVVCPVAHKHLAWPAGVVAPAWSPPPACADQWDGSGSAGAGLVVCMEASLQEVAQEAARWGLDMDVP